MKKVVVAVLLMLGAGVWLAPSVPEGVIAEGNAFSFYRGFERLTKLPYRVHPSISEMCIRVVDPEALNERLKRQHGPHFEAKIFLYANTPLAARTKVSDASAVGTIIVKEKLGAGNEVLAIGGMRKREAGFDPAHGDWEYFYGSKRGGFEIGRLNNCARCHAQTKETDHVYLARMLVPKPESEAARK
jgi:hypothetical protein